MVSRLVAVRVCVPAFNSAPNEELKEREAPPLFNDVAFNCVEERSVPNVIAAGAIKLIVGVNFAILKATLCVSFAKPLETLIAAE